MKTFIATFVFLVALSCGQFLRGGSSDDAAVDVPDAGVCPVCPRQETVMLLSSDLDRCEAEVVTLTNTRIQVKEIPVEKTVVKITPRKCADDGPVIEAVPSTKCMTGQLCLDDEGQRILAKNMAAYEAWVKKVKDCEVK